MKKETRDELAELTTQALIAALKEGKPKASLIAQCIAWVTLWDKGVTATPDEKQKQQAQRIARALEKWEGRLPVSLAKDQREKLSEPFEDKG